jgi:hypothetical protein
MITLKSSTSDGSAFQVYDNDRLIGQIIKTRGPSGDRYLASIDMDGSEKSSDKEFDASHQALQWIEKCRNECP